jgi:hypothetical protein
VLLVELLMDAEIVSADRLASLLEECNELIAILTTISKKVKSQAKG